MFIALSVIYSLLVSFIANSFILMQQYPKTAFILVPVFLLINTFAGIFTLNFYSKRMRVCAHGTILLCAFCVSVVLSYIFHIVLAVRTIPDATSTLLWSLLICVIVNFIVFLTGILCVYLTSTQLGLTTRILGVLLAAIPIANVIVLFFIVKKTARECLFETRKERINRARQAQAVCATRYPILMVHGFFFRDSKLINYWGRIPNELRRNGATVFHGNHQSAESVPNSAGEITARIQEILKETGAEKINIIAHSKGGLDCRYAIKHLGIAPHVASLTTINTPHRGCVFADYLLGKIPKWIQNRVAKTYNTALRHLGDHSPDFLAAARNLTDSYCRPLDEEMGVPEGIFCQSVGSIMYRRSSALLPLDMIYHLVKRFDGPNDGLVGEDSFQWGEKYTLLKPTRRRGISHGDVVDMYRENIQGFDVREFYVELVSDLKNRGC